MISPFQRNGPPPLCELLINIQCSLGFQNASLKAANFQQVFCYSM